MPCRFVCRAAAPVHPAVLDRIVIYEFANRQMYRNRTTQVAGFPCGNAGLHLAVCTLILSPPPAGSAVHSMTSSAVARSGGGTLRPSALAVLRLIVRANLVGWVTSKSIGRSPLRIRPI